ncbi:uncharacterized protein BN467_00396 [Prevotella sp. CAG:1124]|nr:uncharacterized protein BN467_00396 [Prevotella sp. CAG:1124]
MAIHKLIYGISQTCWQHITTRQSSHTDFMLSRLTDIRQPTDQLIPNVMHDGHTKDKESPYLRKGTTKRIKKRNRSGKDKSKPDDTGNDDLTRTTIIRLTETFTGIVVEAIRETGALQEKHGGRQMEIALSFLHLLAEHITINRSPSYYASLLNISPGYLNEIVKEVTGMSVTLYIRNELILQAKRLLVHTGLSIKEISNMLGIDDYAYFSRIFMQTTGISPSAFRLKNHG